MFTVWTLVIGAMISLLVAANRKQKEHLCRDIAISMRPAGDKIYIEKTDILKLIERTGNGSLLNKSVTSIDLARLEKALENSAWVKDAELYFDSKDVLHVLVQERQPVARVFTTEGHSFYIDSSGHAMPLLEKLSARVPVVTGFPSSITWRASDSSLMNEVKQVATVIYGDEFWNAQVGQIDITADHKFELIPVIGDHLIKLGSADKTAEKLNRLFVFYKQVLVKTGFNKYQVLDVQYEGQVVAVKKQAGNPVDSMLLQKNIDEFLSRSIEATDHYTALAITKKDSTVSKTAAQTNSVSTKTNPNPDESNHPNSNPGKIKLPQPIEKRSQTVKENENKPKAVMPGG